MSDEAYNSYKCECKRRGLVPSTKASLEKWEDALPAEVSSFDELPEDAKLVVTKRFLIQLDAAIRKEVVDALS